MGDLAGRDVALKGIEKADELLMPVALYVLPEHLLSQDIERGEKRARSVELVVVGHGGRRPIFISGSLGCVRSRLGSGTFIEAEEEGMSERADVEPDNIVQFLGEGRIAGELDRKREVGPIFRDTGEGG